MSQDTPTLRVFRTAPVIAKRIGEILGEEFPEERVYQWRDAGKIRTFNIGPNVCARDDTLIEDLTGGQRAALGDGETAAVAVAARRAAEMKLCKDCRWAVNLFPEANPPRTYDWQCRHPSSQMPAEPPSLVTGEPREPRR